MTKLSQEQQLGHRLWDVLADKSIPDGQVKVAASTIINETPFVRRELRENAFHPNILDLKPFSESMMVPQIGLEEPIVIGEMEAGQRGAKMVPFDDSADIDTFFFDKFYIRFKKFLTPEFKKSVYNLMSYKNDLRKIVTENALRDMDSECDKAFMDTVDEIVGAVGGVGEAGWEQNFEYSAGINRVSYADIDTVLLDHKLNPGIVLLNRVTAQAFRTWKRDEIGGDMAQEILRSGVAEMAKSKGEFTVWNIPHLATIKSEIVPNNVAYIFTGQEYLGVSIELQPPTMYVSREKDILITQAECRLGTTFANVAGMAKHRWNA